MRRDIWIGDLIRAYARLAPATAAERMDVARVLGLAGEPAVEGPAQPVPSVPDAPVPDDHATTTPVDPAPPAPAPPDGTTETIDDPPSAPGPAAPVRVVGYDEVRGTPATGVRLDDDSGASRPSAAHTPLLKPTSSRAVVQSLLAQRVASGPVDLPALVSAVARRRVDRLPRQLVPTLRLGVQILVDGGKGMAPFFADQDHLVDQVRDIVGPDRTDILYFSGTPLRSCGPGPVWTWLPRSYRPPRPGTPVLLLSDLGVSRRWDLGGAPRPEWEEFAAVTAANDSEVVALVPYPARRWPPWSRRLFTVVTWDRTLSVGHARAARR